MKGLTNKQLKFCNEYVIDFNGTQAAIRSGYSKKTANEQAARLLANVSIQKFLSEIKSKIAEESSITKKQLIDELAKIAFFDIRKIYTVDDALKNVKDFDDDCAAAVAGIETDDIFAGSGEFKLKIGETRKVKIHNKISAIERVSKMLGYDAVAKVEHTGEVIVWNEVKKYGAQSKTNDSP